MILFSRDPGQIESLVETALQEYIQRRKRYKILELFGTIEYEEGYDYKQQRQFKYDCVFGEDTNGDRTGSNPSINP